MRHIFIINPDAGRGKAQKEQLPKILKAVRGKELKYEIHRAMSLESGSRFVRTRCETGESVRFYGCGGDGTINGILNGVVGFPNAEIACIPAGTGNDFIRNFKHPKNFSNVEKQIMGRAIPIDILKYNDQYAVNMLNIGIDCTVVSKAAELKHKLLPGLGGAYLGGAAKTLIKEASFPMTMEFEGGETLEDDFLLVAIGNGCFCGGGFKAAPKAKLNDGFFDVCIVRQVDRRRLPPLLLKYRLGQHLDDEECRKYVTYKQCKRMVISPLAGDRMNAAVDGEVAAYEAVTVELIPEGARFVVPEGCSI